MTGETDRGQTTLDFLIGILVFIAVVLFVFLFVPGILEPFGGADGEDPAAADRIGNSLSSDLLGSSERPRTIDRQCTVEFFNGTDGNPPPECSFDDGQTLENHLNLGPTDRVNVTVRGNLSTTDGGNLCWDQDNNEWTNVGETDCNTPLRAGDNRPGPGTSTITSTRVVSLQGEPVTIEVRVW